MEQENDFVANHLVSTPNIQQEDCHMTMDTSVTVNDTDEEDSNGFTDPLGDGFVPEVRERFGRVNFSTYATYDANEDKTTCVKCGAKLNGKKIYSIKRHYKLVHKMEVTEEKTKKTISIIKTQLVREDFVKSCVGLVAVKNLPVHLFDDTKYFRPLLKPFEECFEMTMNSKYVIEKMNEMSEIVRNSLTRIVANKMICLKIDLATNLNRSLLCVNIQYIKGAKIHVNTLGMIELRKSHTSALLKEEIVSCLEKYKVAVAQLYSCTTDSGANVIKTPELNKNAHESMENADFDEENDCEDNQWLEMLESIDILLPVRCAAHAVQLVAYEVLKTLTTKLTRHRDVIKAIRKYMRNNRDNRLTAMPPLGAVTRWSSAFDMLNFMFSNKADLPKIKEVNQIDWTFCEHFVSAFQPIARCSKQFLQEQYIIGDFYRDWLHCEFGLKSLTQNPFAQKLLVGMQARKVKLLRNNAFIAAIYLDPRFTFQHSNILSEEQKQKAIAHLMRLSESISRMQPDESDERVDSNTTPAFDSPSTSEYSELETELFKYINSTQRKNTHLKTKLLQIAESARIPLESNVLGYWEHSLKYDSELKSVIDVALAVPTTQISVERSFSAISTVLTRAQCSLSEQNISNELIIKLNGDI